MYIHTAKKPTYLSNHIIILIYSQTWICNSKYWPMCLHVFCCYNNNRSAIRECERQYNVYNAGNICTFFLFKKKYISCCINEYCRIKITSVFILIPENLKWKKYSYDINDYQTGLTNRILTNYNIKLQYSYILKCNIILYMWQVHYMKSLKIAKG